MTLPNKDESIRWLEDGIRNEHIMLYEYKHFNNVQQIGFGGFGKVYKANYKNTQECFALKILYENNQDIAYKEIINEVINIIQIFFFLKRKKSLV